MFTDKNYADATARFLAVEILLSPWPGKSGNQLIQPRSTETNYSVGTECDFKPFLGAGRSLRLNPRQGIRSLKVTAYYFDRRSANDSQKANKAEEREIAWQGRAWAPAPSAC